MKNVIVWGNSGFYQRRKDWIKWHEYNILAFIHGEPEYCGTLFEGKKILLPEQIITMT